VLNDIKSYLCLIFNIFSIIIFYLSLCQLNHKQLINIKQQYTTHSYEACNSAHNQVEAYKLHNLLNVLKQQESTSNIVMMLSLSLNINLLLPNSTVLDSEIMIIINKSIILIQ